MLRVLLALVVLLPAAANAKGAKKKSHDGEVWPPPDPATTGQQEEPKPKQEEPKPKDPDPPKSDGDAYKLDPSLTDGEKPTPPKRAREDEDDQAQPSSDEDEDDPCAEKFDDCKEDCAIAHTNDDTLHVKGKLPVAKCVSKCQKKFDLCKEQKENGFGDGKD